MDPRPYPFPPKLSFGQAEEVRRLRVRGVCLADLAQRFGVAKSSVSAIVKHKAHEIPGTFRVALPEFEAAPRTRDKEGRCEGARVPPPRADDGEEPPR